MSELQGRPKSKSSFGEKELDKAQEQFQQFDENIKAMTLDRMNEAPKEDKEQQTKMAQSDISKQNGVYLKPSKTIGCRDKFNEKFREAYNFAKEYVNFIAENKEIIGETIDIWTRPFGGMPVEYWNVPTNKPIWGPRYLAENIKKATYHRLVMQDSSITGGDNVGKYYGAMAVDTTIQRLDAHPVSQKRSIFMGSSNFN